MQSSEEPPVDLVGGHPAITVPLKKRKHYRLCSQSFSQGPSSLPEETNTAKKDQLTSEHHTTALNLPIAAEEHTLSYDSNDLDGNANTGHDKYMVSSRCYSISTLESSSEVGLRFEGKLDAEDGAVERLSVDFVLGSERKSAGQSREDENCIRKPKREDESTVAGVSGNLLLPSEFSVPSGMLVDFKDYKGRIPKQKNILQSTQICDESCSDVPHGNVKDSVVIQKHASINSQFNLTKSENVSRCIDGIQDSKKDPILSKEQVNVWTQGNLIKPEIECTQSLEKRSIDGIQDSKKDPILSNEQVNASTQGRLIKSEIECTQSLENRCIDGIQDSKKDPISSTEQVNVWTQGNLMKPETECTQSLEKKCFDGFQESKKDPIFSKEPVNAWTQGSFMKPEIECTQSPEKRPLLDLNTTLDTWEGSVSDFSSNPSVNGINVPGTCGLYDKMPSVGLKDMIDSIVTSTECNHSGSKGGKFSFDFLSCFDQGIRCSFAKEPLVKREIFEKRQEMLGLADNVASLVQKTVKAEQFDVGCDLKTVGSSSNTLQHRRVPKLEASEGISQECIKHVDRNTLASENSGSIKLEAVDKSSEREGGFSCSANSKLGGEKATIMVEALDRTSESMVPDAIDAAVTENTLEAAQVACSEVVNPELSTSVSCEVVHQGLSTVVGGDAESDWDEKINLSVSIHEDDLYYGDSESDSLMNADIALGSVNGKVKDDDIEDGEVREALVNDSCVDNLCEGGEMEPVSNGELDCEEECRDQKAGRVVASLDIECTDVKTMNPLEDKIVEDKIADLAVENDNVLCIEKKEKGNSSSLSSKKSSDSTGSKILSAKKPMKSCRLTPKCCTRKKESCSEVVPTTPNQGLVENPNSEIVTGEDVHDTVRNLNASRGSGQGIANISSAESLTGSNEACRIDNDRNSNLPKASNISKLRSNKSAPVAFHAENGKFESLPRDDGCMDGNRKFVKPNLTDGSISDTGPSFLRKRKRVDNVSENFRWYKNTNRNFGSRNYSTAGARFSRPENIDMVNAAEFGHSGMANDPENPLPPHKTGRKHMNVGLESSSRQPSFRRRYPCERGPLGPRMVQRPERVISPERRGTRGGPDVVVTRLGEKFFRDMPDDAMEHMLPHSRPESFDRRERSTSPVQRHVYGRLPTVCSKSSRRFRERSPCSWGSPGRSSNQLNRHTELLRHRSPPVFRERMRSPQHQQQPCFDDRDLVRRHGSPPLPDEVRRMRPSRPFMLTRSPSGRVLERSTRRYNMIYPQEREEGDAYFEPLQSDSYDELDDCVSDQPRCQELLEPIHSFRPHDEEVNVERYRYHENGSRQYRSSPGVEFHSRDGRRDLHGGRFRGRLGNPRRRGTMGKQDARIHNSEWCEASFGDPLRVRKARF